VALSEASDRRRTVGDAVFMLGPNSWVSVDARLPGPLLAEAVRGGGLDALRGYRVVRLEYPVPDEPGSRLDLLLEGPAGLALVEAKSVTLVEKDGTALFPDAPTLRGQRHLQVLANVRRAGMEALVVFVAQRPDALRFSPHRAADPAFSRGLVEAARQGVKVLAFSCRVRPPRVEILRPIEVRLDEPA
ncbi:MAG: DNA/RNA nuclease SfsA, partial [Bacillota bacterium]